MPGSSQRCLQPVGCCLSWRFPQSWTLLALILFSAWSYGFEFTLANVITFFLCQNSPSDPSDLSSMLSGEG